MRNHHWLPLLLRGDFALVLLAVLPMAWPSHNERHPRSICLGCRQTAQGNTIMPISISGRFVREGDAEKMLAIFIMTTDLRSMDPDQPAPKDPSSTPFIKSSFFSGHYLNSSKPLYI